ncbi:MAG TPA: ATP-binding cassette domain-containing protein [Candidatus Omnitrophica bacterium]|nr:ATP-binding cassette domain-containing protein [Candidatus Omnitrophota bacterium]
MLRLEALTRNWGDFRLNEISLELEKGEYHVLLGPCGAGKTLLLETIAGFWRPQKGRIYLGEKDITFLPPERREIGFVYQEYFLFPHLSVKENILYGLKVRKRLVNSKKVIDDFVDLLDMVDIIERRDVTSLSGGEQQKVALARALVWKPRLLLLDEPLHSLDFTIRGRVCKLLRELNKKLAITIIHVTHDYTEAKKVAQTISILDRGTIVDTKTADEIFEIPHSSFRNYL